MCAVSMTMQHRIDHWKKRVPPRPPFPSGPPRVPLVTREEIDEFRDLLERAREYDKRHQQPDCELDEKRQELKKLADQLGIEIAFL